jgi:hypothetical protein
LIKEIPQIKIAEYAFKNAGNLKFDQVTAEWGIKTPSFSNGAAYVDLDNGGCLAYGINTINNEAFLYKNTTYNKEKITKNILSVQFKGGEKKYNRIGNLSRSLLCRQQHTGVRKRTLPWRFIYC